MKKISYNPYDEAYKEMWDAMFKAYKSLEETTNKIIVRKGVIDLYPEGDDKKQAIKDYEDTKQFLVEAINQYDEKVQEVIEYFSNHHEEMKTCREWTPSRMATGHEVVEHTYEKKIKG